MPQTSIHEHFRSIIVELSRLYAGACLAEHVDPARYDMRLASILDAIEIPSIGNPALMATAADQAKTREIVAAAGVRVPARKVAYDDTDGPLPAGGRQASECRQPLGIALAREGSQYSQYGTHLPVAALRSLSTRRSWAEK